MRHNNKLFVVLHSVANAEVECTIVQATDKNAAQTKVLGDPSDPEHDINLIQEVHAVQFRDCCVPPAED